MNSGFILLRELKGLKLPKTNYARICINSVLFKVCLLWKRLPLFIKKWNSSTKLKIKQKELGNIDCSCLICRDSICDV